MILDYYQHEIDLLRNRSKVFATLHPALAHMLSEESTDPDVERILEGCAYLSANIRQKLDDELPELIHSLLNIVAPHYLCPQPSATIIAFTPRRGLNECLTIPRKTQLNSVEIEGVACPFTTCSDVEIAPLELESVESLYEKNERGMLKLRFHTLNNLPLSIAAPKRLRLYCTGPYSEAARRVMLICQHAKHVRIIPEENTGGQAVTLPGSTIRMVGFDEEDSLIPYPVHSFTGFRYLQEFFLLPERFCQLEITGFANWKARGEGQGFTIEIALDSLPADPPSVTADHLRLFVTPAVNIFPMDGKPIRLDHRKEKYNIFPAGGRNSDQYVVYSVEKITGMRQGESTPHEYRRFIHLNPGSSPQPVYSLSCGIDPYQGLVIKLSVGQLSDEKDAVPEVLSLNLLCTNGRLPEKLHAGDICRPTDTSPQLADFTNLRVPTLSALPPLGDNTLWRLLSHLFLNYLSVATPENLRSILKLYIFNRAGDNSTQVSHIGRVEGIKDLRINQTQKLVHGEMLRGMSLNLTLKTENYANDGDMYVFSSVLNAFLSTYASVNTFTALHMKDTNGRIDASWPARLGTRALL